MTPTKLLIGQIIVVFGIVLAGVWFATQWAAAALAYQPELGRPWFISLGRPVYRPWALFGWWFSFDAYAPKVFGKAGVIAAASGIAGCAAAIFGSLWRARQRANLTTYGSARWADADDIGKAGLLTEAGVFLGRTGPHCLRHDGPEHIMAFAPTRSGKGVGLVVPTLLGWTGSAVIHDIKGENWQLTAGWRQRFSHCLLFNPTDARSARYNPLLEVRRGTDEVRDVQNIADILVDPEGALERRSHWEKTSHSLLVGAILHILYAEEDKTLALVASFLSDPQRPFTATLARMMTTNHLGTTEAPIVHPVVASAAREVLNKSENERSGVLSTAMSFLGLYRDPTVATVTSRCDWRIADLVEGKSPVSLYLVVPPSDISRTKPLIRLVLNQIGRRLTEHLHAENGADAANRHKLLMMLDEFPALGRLDFFETSLAFLAGYGVRAFLIAQSLNQIEKAYGDHNAILDNCHVRVAFASNDERTAKRISDALGTATEQRAMRNYAGHRLAPWLAHVMVSRQETARALLTPGEVMQLPATDELVLVAGMPPTHLAKEFALSDVALHKICKKHDIPNPPLGWWAKKAAGKPVKQAPLPKAKAGTSDGITIAAGELRQEPELIAAAREHARLMASSIDAEAALQANSIVDRTIAQLRKAKPSPINGLVSVEGLNIITASVALASIERLELALSRIVAAAEALGINLVRGQKAASFEFDGETIGFSISEGIRREKHVPTEKELAEQEAARKRRTRRSNNSNSWNDDDFTWSSMHRPEWDYHPTGQLAFELEQFYLISGSPRRSFKDAKVQRIEKMASDIAVGIMVLAAAKKDDHVKRAEQARQREEERRVRELAFRRKHVAERRGKALEEVLEELASLDRLRRLVSGLRRESMSGGAARVAEFLALAEHRLALRTAALSADGLEQRFENQKLFGDDDDHAFRPPSGYY